jgi:penicillin-binding protein-related factor A (putative recombinase)
LATNPGKIFEESLKQSAIESGTFFYRIKDVPPIMLKKGSNVSKNDFDSFIFKPPNLFALELKSTQNKSFSFSEKIIKAHQIKALTEAAEHDGVISGFIFNFREYDNYTAFVHIRDFNHIKQASEQGIISNKYIHKLNKSSISLDTVKEVGVELKCVKKKVRYRYYINQLLNELIEKYKS